MSTATEHRICNQFLTGTEHWEAAKASMEIILIGIFWTDWLEIIDVLKTELSVSFVKFKFLQNLFLWCRCLAVYECEQLMDFLDSLHF